MDRCSKKIFFPELKQVLVSTPVLGLLDFLQTFVIERDASSTLVGVVPLQDVIL